MNFVIGDPFTYLEQVLVTDCHDFSERSDWLMSMNYLNLLLSSLKQQTLPKMDCKFIINEPFDEYLIYSY